MESSLPTVSVLLGALESPVYALLLHSTLVKFAYLIPFHYGQLFSSVVASS